MIVVAGLLVLASACIVDPDQRCGPNQTLSEFETCECNAASIWNTDQTECVPCRWDEVRVGSKCACRDGYVRHADGVRCEVDFAAGQPPPDAPPPAMTEVPETQDLSCADHGECGTNEYCRPIGDAAQCSAVPTGMGEPCESDQDCADYDATHCQTFGKVCLVSQCSMAPDDCPPDWGCCDLSTYGLDNVCVPVGTCPTN